MARLVSATDRDLRAEDAGATTRDDAVVIRNVVIHIANEQPVIADLYEMPLAADVSLVCTNVRMLDGKKPIFIDHAQSVFAIPYSTLRFIEIPARSATGMPDLAPEPGETTVQPAPVIEEPEADIELDEDFLRRIRDV